jgi:hypothetical protein
MTQVFLVDYLSEISNRTKFKDDIFELYKLADIIEV